MSWGCGADCVSPESGITTWDVGMRPFTGCGDGDKRVLSRVCDNGLFTKVMCGAPDTKEENVCVRM